MTDPAGLEEARTQAPDGATGAAADAWDRAPVALLRVDGDGTVLAANRTLLRWLGREADDVVGGRLSAHLTVGGRIYWETHLAPLLRMQGGVDEVAVELRGPDGALPVLLSARVTAAGVDVALTRSLERARYERELLAARREAETASGRLAVLQDVTAALSRAAGVDAVVRVVLDAAAEALGAGGAAVWLTGPDGRLDRAAERGEPTPAPRQATPEAPATLDDGTVLVPLDAPSGPVGVVALAAPRRAGYLGGPAGGPDPSGSALADGSEAWPPDPDLLTALGRQTGVALERAAAHDRSTSVAHELQHAMLAVTVPHDPRCTITTIYRPGVEAFEVGGDWYDVTLVREDVVAVAVGDVVGRGLQAASSMGQLRSAVRALAGDTPPGELLSRLDRYVHRTGVGFMTTLAYAEVDLRTGVVRYACAGHLPPLVVGDRATFQWDGRSAPLGVRLRGTRRDAAETRLAPGDRFMLYTDGLVERRDRPLDDGLAALAAAAESLDGRPVERLVEDALTDPGEHDDVCLLALTWHG